MLRYSHMEAGTLRVPDSSTGPNSLEYGAFIAFDGDNMRYRMLRKAYRDGNVIANGIKCGMKFFAL